MLRSHLLVTGVLALVAGCAGMRHNAATRYQGMLLDTREFGADELARVTGADPAVRAYVAAHGRPDFLVVPDAANVELIYYLPSVLAQFHRPSPGAPSALGVLSPLPDGVLNLLPRDIRAGTPTPDPSNPISNCWTVAIGATTCRTCCSGDLACQADCHGPPSK
ncbi:MAG TPA: hypothetical protein VKW76_11130 [Candidatus Binatia bacterium]|nr:hypothetical protein [Candidatus Binatia bacterium]